MAARPGGKSIGKESAGLLRAVGPIRLRLLRWFDRNNRDLPWRAKRGRTVDPYRILLSELMLQQTQVATVIPYYLRFVAAYPTLADLAAADEQAVLRLWQGLGYYSRARNLLAAARQIVARHAGRLPSKMEDLIALPGVGRYTAGAVGSIALGLRVPVVDGNVRRVLCRLDGIESDPAGSAVRERLWARAERLVPARRPGDFNSALMELGATVCRPRNPDCPACPLEGLCLARRRRLTDLIPRPAKRRHRPTERRMVLCVRDAEGRYLVEQRPRDGRWAGMWQFITRPAGRPPPAARQIAQLSHDLTHRRYRFEVYLCDHQEFPRDSSANGGAAEFLSLTQIESRPMPRPHVKIARMLSGLG